MHCGACDKDNRDRINYLAHLKKIHFILATTELLQNMKVQCPMLMIPTTNALYARNVFLRSLVIILIYAFIMVPIFQKKIIYEEPWCIA